jgi:gamma-glutamyltranspeptidase / glutathione hydrolase
VFLQQLALLSGFDLTSQAPGSPQLIHTVTESAKLAFADREAWYGDPDFTDVPLDDLLSASYNDARRTLIGETASGELRPGSPGGRSPELPAFAIDRDGAKTSASGDPGLDPATGEPLGRETTAAARRGDTCHLDVADRWGNVVTATPSGGWLQSSPVIPELGFCLGTRGQMFTLTPGLPATIAPGKRPRTTLTPTLVLRDGEPYVAFGTPGGDQQDQWTLGFFLGITHYGMNLQQAIDFPAYHTRHMPSSFYPRDSYPRTLDVEERVGAGTVADLRRRGHEVTVRPPWSLGRISAVARRDGMLYAGANPRGMQSYAAGR